MTNPVFETTRRLRLANRIVDKFRDLSIGIILAGSVAYSPNLNVTESSDVDILVITENLKRVLPFCIEDEEERKALEKRVFEGYCIKADQEGVPISVHVISKDAFDIISKCFVADIRVYRNEAKPGNYNLFGFERNCYKYSIKNISLEDLEGVRTIVPISFIHTDRYFIGIHRDKLLSNPRVMFDKDGFVADRIDTLWQVVVENLYDESRRIYSGLDLNQMNVLNALAKRDKMCPEVIEQIKDRTKFYLKAI
tara:strand:+ start:805 stop:1560 length:756 start_codon:yes stop_codon:yes gene_type:complete